MHVAIISFMVSSSYCSPIQDLIAAKKQLQEGKKSIADGKQGVIDGYNQIKSDVVDTMNNAARDIQKQMDELNEQKSAASDVLDKKLPELHGIIAASGLVTLGISWVLLPLVPIIEAVLWDVPKTLNAINNPLESIVDTLHAVTNTINPSVEQINPKDMVILLQQIQFKIADIKTKIKDEISSSWWLNSSFKDTMNSITDSAIDTINHQIQEAQSNIDPIKEKTRDIGTMEAISKKMKDLKNSSIDEIKKNLDAKNSLENYFTIPMKKDKDGNDTNEPDEDAKNSRIEKIKNWLDSLTKWDFVDEFDKQIARDKDSKQDIPLVYQKFNSATQKFDVAIEKIDKITALLKKIAEDL
jgi:hypothetical protein